MSTPRLLALTTSRYLPLALPRSTHFLLACTLEMGMMNTGSNQRHSDRVKVTRWLLVSGIVISLLLADGIQAAQTAIIGFAVPVTLIILLMIAARRHGMHADSSVHERALRRRLEDLSVESHGKPLEQP